MPIRQAEAEGFPHHRLQVLPGGVTWLALGFDADRHAAVATASGAPGSETVNWGRTRAGARQLEGSRVRTHNQNMTIAAIQIAERNSLPHLS